MDISTVNRGDILVDEPYVYRVMTVTADGKARLLRPNGDIETTPGGTFTYENGTKIITRINTEYNEGLSYLLAGAGMMGKAIKDYTIEVDEVEGGEATESGYLMFREIV